MCINKTHTIRLYPTKEQESFFKKSCGVARFAYNWALNKWNENHKNGKNTNHYSLIKELNSIKRDEYPWMLEIGKCSPQYAIHDLKNAFERFFSKQSNYPLFKKKNGKDSFVAVENELSFKQNDFRIWIPKLGLVKSSENLRFIGKVNYVVIKRIANIWFASICIKTESTNTPIASENQAVVGVDVGIKSMIVLSDGTFVENPQALKKRMKSIKRHQRALSKKYRNGRNYQKQKTKFSKLHYRVTCVRQNAIHQATSKIIKNYDVIVIEDLNVAGMLKNSRISKALRDVSFGEIARQLAYKALWSGKELVVADRWFASSKTCSCCGMKKSELKMSERIFRCEYCGNEIDRDLNAAKNLANYGTTLRFSGSHACGVGSSVAETQYSLTGKQEALKANRPDVQLFLSNNTLNIK